MIETERLVLRPWREADRDPYWVMTLEPEVMEFLPAQTRVETDAAIDRMIAMQGEHGHCLWALEAKQGSRFIGCCGLVPPRAPTFEYELGWRLERGSWGEGLACEAAKATLAWAWHALAAANVVAITVPQNRRSRALMERLGMAYQPGEDFDHPDLPEGSPLRRHVLYRIARPV